MTSLKVGKANMSREKDSTEEQKIYDAHPLYTGRHDLYTRALRLVSERKRKADFVGLVNWLLAESESWRPIETAPHDGTDVLVWNGDVRTISMWGKVSHVPTYGWLDMVWADIEDADLLDPQPSYWMPLPEPPKPGTRHD